MDFLEEEGGDVGEEPAELVQEECVYVKSVLYFPQKKISLDFQVLRSFY